MGRARSWLFVVCMSMGCLLAIGCRREPVPNNKVKEAKGAPGLEVIAYVNGEEGNSDRAIKDCVKRTNNDDPVKPATLDDNVRVITGGWVKFKAVSGQAGRTYKWKFSAGEPTQAVEGPSVDWDAPTADEGVQAVTLTIEITGGPDAGATSTVKIYPVSPQVVRVRFADPGTGGKVALLDCAKGAIAGSDGDWPEYDRTKTDWEAQAGGAHPAGMYHEAKMPDASVQNEDGKVFKNESAAFKRGTKMRVLADVAATDKADKLPDASGTLKPHTPHQHEDLSALTPIKLAVLDEAPALTFKNASSGDELGTAFDVGDWSVQDYASTATPEEATFTSQEKLGEPDNQGATAIRFYWETTLKWRIMVKSKELDAQGNHKWVSAWGSANNQGKTWDTVHRSLCVPEVVSNGTFEKVMQYSCDWAKGKTGTTAAEKKAVVDACWTGIDRNDTSQTGARLDINYTFRHRLPGQQVDWSMKGFLRRRCEGSCGHHSDFFRLVGKAQGVQINVRACVLQPAAVGFAHYFATNSKDVDGDWAERGGGPVVGGNALWYWGDHAFCEYAGDIYDPSMGAKKASATWAEYMSAAASWYAILIAPTQAQWRTKNDVANGGGKVRWLHFLDGTRELPDEEWPPFP